MSIAPERTPSASGESGRECVQSDAEFARSARLAGIMGQLPEHVRSSVVARLQQALELLDGLLQSAPVRADWTWVQGASLLLQSSLDLLTRATPCSQDSLASAVELSAKAGLCLASVLPENLTAEVSAAGLLISQVYAELSPFVPSD